MLYFLIPILIPILISIPILIVIIFIILFNLRNRVGRLENLIFKELKKVKTESNYEPQPQQPAPQTSNITESLISYIKQQLKVGSSKEEIKTTLINNGWQEIDIEKAFNLVFAPISQNIKQDKAIIEEKEKSSLDEFIEWLKEDWLMKLGGLLLIIGFGWFTTYAFLNNWIGPMGRIAFGLIIGSLFILFGWWRIRTYINQGGFFIVLGSTAILITMFAARQLYNFFDPLSAIIIMFLSAAFVALASVKYNNRALALASLILAGIAPLLTNAPKTNYVGLFLYLFVMTLGGIWIVFLTGRRELTAAALLIILFYSLPHLFKLVRSDREILLPFIYAFAALFFLTNTIGILKLRNKYIVPDIVTAGGNGLFLIAWIMIAAKEEWKSLIISSWMIVFLVGGFLIFKITQRREPFYVYCGVGIAMLAAATSVELKGATLMIAYTIESGIIPLITYFILKDIKIAQKTSLLLIIPMYFSLNNIDLYRDRYTDPNLISENFFVILILGLVLLGLGLFFLRRTYQINNEKPSEINIGLLVAGSIYLYILLWLFLHKGFENEIATTICLVVYTIVGIISYIYGFSNQKRVLKIYGGLIVGFVVLRLLLIDIWKMELTGRIVTFFLIGALLISTAFLTNRKKEQKSYNV
jgi:uncharacterized membrane protein